MTSLRVEAFQFVNVLLCFAVRAAARGSGSQSLSRAMQTSHHSRVSGPHGF